MARGANGDVWKDLLQTSSRQENMRTAKVKSHLPFEAIAKGMISLPQYVLNNVADVAAAVAAGAAQPPDALQEWHSKWQARAFRVALRIAAMEAWHWRQTPKKIAKPKLEHIIVPDQEAVRAALVTRKLPPATA